MSEKILCDACNIQLNNYRDYGIHMREEHNKYYCGACREGFSDQRTFEDHIKDKHGVSPESTLS